MTSKLENQLRLVFFGPPGAGKGTQAQLLTDELRIPHISSGDLFRQNLKDKTPLGLRASQYMKEGLLVPDEVTIDIVLNQVLSLDSQNGFILDGFPRNQHQGEVLEEALEIRSRPLDRVVYIDVPEPELVRRLGGRYICQECQAPHNVEPGTTPGVCERCGNKLRQRDDDQPEAVRKRIEIYRNETMPVLDFYRQRGLLTEVAGVGTVEMVYKGVLKALDWVSKSNDRE